MHRGFNVLESPFLVILLFFTLCMIEKKNEFYSLTKF